MEIKVKINKSDLTKLKKLLHNERKYKLNEKTTLRMGENNSKWNKWQIINLQIYTNNLFNSIVEKKTT